MIKNPLIKDSKETKLTEKDVPKLKHNFIMMYGYDCWQSIGLDEFFEMLPEMTEEMRKREQTRIATLIFYGMKNPK